MTSNDFSHKSGTLETQAARSQVITQLYNEVFLNLSNPLFWHTKIVGGYFVIPQVFREDTAVENGALFVLEIIGEIGDGSSDSFVVTSAL